MCNSSSDRKQISVIDHPIFAGIAIGLLAQCFRILIKIGAESIMFGWVMPDNYYITLLFTGLCIIMFLLVPILIMFFGGFLIGHVWQFSGRPGITLIAIWTVLELVVVPSQSNSGDGWSGIVHVILLVILPIIGCWIGMHFGEKTR